MLKFNWDRLSVLVVDDNAFVRDLIVATIKAFGILNVIADSDGSTAIERLKLSTVDPHEAKLGTVDLILSDYVMPAVDGNLFLRWIRTGSHVPDRFVPFIMVSGAADREIVEQARDTGVTEFLAKPFSAKTMADSLQRVINHPRQFVLAQGYFGPDRRRSSQRFGEERRVTEPSQIQVIRRASNEKTLREDVRAIHFRLSNRLLDKIGPYNFKGEVDIDPLIIQAAEQRIQSMVGDYADWVGDSIRSLVQWQESLARKEGDPAKLLQKINRVAHELRGQGGIFDYQLTTAFGKSLYEATSPKAGSEVSANKVKLIGAHIEAISTVFKNKIKGNGGQVGLALLQEIETAVRKYS